MGLFNNIMSKIFGHAEASGPKTVSSVGGPDVAGSVGTQTIEQVDVVVILNGLAAKNPERLDWKGSIVDLMKLVGMDSSLSARKQLATELHYSGDQSDTAAMNSNAVSGPLSVSSDLAPSTQRRRVVRVLFALFCRNASWSRGLSVRD